MKRTMRGGARPIRRRALVNLILFLSIGSCVDLVLPEAPSGDSCVDLVLVTICEAGRREEKEKEWARGVSDNATSAD